MAEHAKNLDHDTRNITIKYFNYFLLQKCNSTLAMSVTLYFIKYLTK